jgi:hypothetical protein
LSGSFPSFFYAEGASPQGLRRVREDQKALKHDLTLERVE